MAERKTRRSRLILVWCAPLAAALAAGALSLPASAQERPRGVLERLFGPPIGQRAQPQAQPPQQIRRQQAQPRRQQAQPRRQGQRQQAGGQRRNRDAARSAAPAAPPVQAVEKAENARDVLIVGDFLAASLARGLTDATATNRDVRIVPRANGSSGLVRDDYYDWLANLPGLIEETGAELVVVMLGSNDRQAIRIEGRSEAVRSESWTQEYTRRTQALAAIVGEKGLPLVWVGMPPFQSNRMTEDMVFLNDLYTRAAASVDGEFVDIWGGFVDAGGAYTASGPDPTGQPARLRNSDGITMTAAGSAKLAYYAEKPIMRLLGLSVDDLLVSLAPHQLPEGDLPAAVAPPAEPENVRALPPVALTDPSLFGGDALLGGGSAAPRSTAMAGAMAEAMPGRADSFNWTGRGAAVSPATQNNAIVFRGSTSLDSLRARAQGDTPSPEAEPAAGAE
ncbi:SGNH/GDSL hydrolase family protein [Aureimonas populi]|uniref:DUF459 domain-containing protein n=1 Tax=Aureimonas populi TaxID=1701758 RepID=A0ABW5CQN9_9HYPH|nr:DUF459 domain-containing protein [Aureimonas populi]